MSTDYEMVVGLEVHSQLLTRTKLFCRCENRFGAPPNSLTCPVCLGHPGVLPVLNEEAVRLGIRLGLALECSIHHRSVFDRKHYFYPDLPKGYQISQFTYPLLTGGLLTVRSGEGTREIRIHRIHMEEDAGKNMHAGIRDASHVDLNRSGVPLLEIVSEPDIRTPEEAVDYLKKLRQILRAIGVSDGNMEEGSFRCDANVSLRPRGGSVFGTKVEIKNMNSFRFVHKALLFECDRQAQLLDRGERVVSETRLFDSSTGRTLPMRSKEEALDYRYFPEPDLPPILLDPAWIEEERSRLPELPQERVSRLSMEFGIREEDAEALVLEEDLSRYFEEASEAIQEHAGKGGWPVEQGTIRLVNFLLSEVLREWNRKGSVILGGPLAAREVSHLVAMVVNEQISLNQAKDVYAVCVESLKSPREVVAEKNMFQESGDEALGGWIAEVVAENPGEVQSYREGKERVFGFLVGQVMKKSAGKANPQKVNRMLKESLSR
ncbi:MAG: Asp-tRNA(Asn)/Glu-tRNA(Gln) amidotransferase subunit GatB [Leptospirales bacterium]